MTDPTQTDDFEWLKHDAAPILGDARPRTIKELLGKDKLWLDIYRDWLQENNPGFIDGLKYVAETKGQQAEYTRKLSQVYPNFYKAAGDLKDAVRKGPAALANFRWAPADPRSLLGDPRPKTFADLVDDGVGSAWSKAFRGWLATFQPFADAAGWFDWVLALGNDTDTWEQVLEPTMPLFADDIGKLKERLRETHGNKAQRAMRQVGDAAGDAAEWVNATGTRAARQVGEAAEYVNTMGDRGGLIGLAQGQGQPGQGQPGQGQPGQGQPGAARQPAAAGAARQPAAGAAVGQPKAAAAAGRPSAPAPQRPSASQQVMSQLTLAAPLIDQAGELSRWVSWLAERFAAFGGSLAAEVGNLRGYQAMIDRDSARLAQQIGTARGRLRAGNEELYTRLANVRKAVYALAWDVDLGYPNYYGGWPHQRISMMASAVMSADSAQLSYEAGGVLARLSADVDGVYDIASALLDTALEVVAADLPGYDGEDGAEAWGTHEVVGARTEVAALVQLAAQWAAQPPAEEEDPGTVDAAASEAFGMPYQSFLQVAGQFQ